MSGTLFVVSTPIGNLEDITLRAIRTLKEADLIAAEDTRRAGILLNAYGIKKELMSFHSYNAKSRVPGIVSRLKEGKNVAIVSDSGTPGISDPGHVIIKECVKENIPVTAVPGPSAVIAALVLSGLPTAKFVFEGFLSNKKARRKKQLETLLQEKRTVILYESPHRICAFLADLMEIAGDRQIAIARELTKKFEEIRRGTAKEHLEHFEKNGPRGEFVVVF